MLIHARRQLECEYHQAWKNDLSLRCNVQIGHLKEDTNHMHMNDFASQEYDASLSTSGRQEGSSGVPDSSGPPVQLTAIDEVCHHRYLQGK